MVKKTTKNTKRSDRPSTFPPSSYDYINGDIILNPENEEWRGRLVKALVDFGKDKNQLHIMDFCDTYNIRRRTLYDYREKYPDVKQAYDDMATCIARNRMVGAMKNELNYNAVVRGLWRLDPEEEANDMRKHNMDKELKLAKLESEKERQVQTINLILPDAKVESVGDQN
jgi:hypothetical protein